MLALAQIDPKTSGVCSQPLPKAGSRIHEMQKQSMSNGKVLVQFQSELNFLVISLRLPMKLPPSAGTQQHFCDQAGSSFSASSFPDIPKAAIIHTQLKFSAECNTGKHPQVCSV